MTTKIAFNVGVVLPAAGCGERMKLSTPKQYCEVNGRPLICYTIDCFHRLPWIRSIVISTSKGQKDLLQGLVSKFGFDKVTMVEGGTTRHRSICAGVKALQQVSPDTEVVVIHDAVRPFVSSDILENIAMAAHDHGAAGVCRPLVSTVIARDTDHLLTESLDRSRYFNSEMPQAFHVPVISSAYDKCTSDDFEYGTECLLLAMKYSGVRAKILDGNADLWKVTYKKDLYSAEAVIKERMTRVALVNGESWPQLVDSITAELQSRQFQIVQQPDGEMVKGDRTADGQTPTDAPNTFIVLYTDLNPLNPNVNSDLNSASRNTEMNIKDGNKDISGGGSDPSMGTNGTLKTKKEQKDSECTKKEFDTDACAVNLLNKVTSVQNKYRPSHNSSKLMDYSFLHVFVVTTETEMMELQPKLCMGLLRLSCESRENSVLLYGLVTKEDASAKEVAHMAVSVIQRGHYTFSGQLFCV